MTALQTLAADIRPGAQVESDLRPVTNLLDDLDGLARRLSGSLSVQDCLDSYLLAAGMNQVTEDYLHRDVVMLGRVTSKLRGLGSPAGRLAGAASDAARRSGLTFREWSSRERAVRGWQRRLASLAQVLADRVAEPSSEHAGAGIGATASALLDQVPALPRPLRRTILRMPTCFQSLDQNHADCSTLAAGFAERWPDRERIVRILGLRTSGSYLAPLVSAYLRRAGYRDVTAWTVRPSDELCRDERKRLLALIESNALLLVVDDPPKSGSSLVKAVAWLERRGLPRERLVMLVPLTGSASTLPEQLTGYQAVILPWSRWSVHTRLEPRGVRDALEQLLVGRVITVTPPNGSARDVKVRAVTAVKRLREPPITDLKSGSPVRRHVRALFEVCVEDVNGREFVHRVYAKGVGLGYFGRHSLTVADALTDFVPKTYGLSDGLLFRAWMPEEARLQGPDASPEIVESLSGYVLARQANLSVPADVSERMAGLNPVWQRVADMIATPFGQGRSIVRPFTHAAARHLLRVANPSVIDGSMALGQWFRGSSGAHDLVKVDYDERAYSNQDTVVDQLYSFDAVFDLAAAAADLQLHCTGDEGSVLAARMRRRFESRSGRVGDERWLLYQLLVLKSYRQFLEAMRAEVDEGTFPDLTADVQALLQPAALAEELQRVRRVMSRLDQEYWGDFILRDLRPNDSGQVCAIDIDGVLETDRLGYSSVTPLGALALRSLIAHGHRPILATGRSVDEVRDRCRAFGLDGGVAEYGAAFYDGREATVRDLLAPQQRDDLDRLRSALASTPNIHVAGGYRRSVRASLVTRDRSKPLPNDLVRAQLEALGLTGRVRAVHGWAQTDFMAAGVDKGSGVNALLDHIDRPSAGATQHRLSFAIGDGAEDVPIIGLAQISVAPANAEPVVLAAGARLMRGRHQAGLAQGVQLLVGHRPGRCDRCRPPAISADAAMLLSALRAQEGGKLTQLRQAAWLAVQVLRA